MYSRLTSICDQSFSESAASVLANLMTDSVHVAEKKSVCTCLGSFCRMRFVVSPKPPSASISSASSSTNIRIPAGSQTRMLTSVQILPGVPITIWSPIESPRSNRSSRSTVLIVSPDSSSRYLPIFSTSSTICFASSRVGQMQSACGFFSEETTLSMPSTKHAVLPVPLCDCASRLRCAQIFGSDAAWIFDGRTKFISYSPLSSGAGSASSGESKLLHVTE
mmetsp:Transcript_64334/g.176578  ORF Transcript_64334/g.176578 Transcript_64334/m.176578 type:complete len:221 (-) Transcript_64334:136-798(-)